ncbi:MAG: pilus assembly protein [Actinomyces sp.]|nr:MAG: pilus assembly protein [Actinomyces sp.]
MGQRRHDETGVTTIQVAILFPVVLFWIMLIVQYGLWWHAKQVANAAAAEAVATARVPDGDARLGEDAARSYLAQAGNLANVTVSVTWKPTLVTAEVHGDAPRLVPGFNWSVTARSAAPVERFIPEPER